jgi:putative transposase
MARQCKLLKISRRTAYYKARGESSFNKNLKKMILEEFNRHPFYGVPRMTAALRRNGFAVNKKRIERLYKSLNIRAVMPSKNLTKSNKEHEKYPYLLRDMKIEKPNQVWQTDISYIPMAKGFMYVSAFIDVFSRRILSWSVSNTMTKELCAGLLKEAIGKYGKTDIVNTDQGSQYTSNIFINVLKSNSIKISMDGKGRALDNIYIERFWRSLKYEDLFLKSYENGLALHKGFKSYIDFYNAERVHQSLEYQTPDDVYFSTDKPECESAGGDFPEKQS